MSSLHQLLSPELSAVDDCLAFIQAGDTILLADEGADLACVPGQAERLLHKAGPGGLVMLRADALARGLEPAAQAVGIPLLGDPEWVELARAHDHVLSWK
jgi:sulfur relay protein TusB/DsrH